MSNNQSSKELMEGTSTFRQAIEESNNNDAGVSKQVEQEDDDYNQSADVDFSDINIRGKHFLVKAPEKKTESGLILSDKQQKDLQSVSDTPGFNPDVYAVAVDELCTKVEENDMVLLSPHMQAMEIDMVTEDEEKVLYLMIHEDYILMTKQK